MYLACGTEYLHGWDALTAAPYDGIPAAHKGQRCIRCAGMARQDLALIGPNGEPLTEDGSMGGKTPKNRTGGGKRRRNGRWSPAETNALITLVRQFGKGKWKKILEEGGPVFNNRSQVGDSLLLAIFLYHYNFLPALWLSKVFTSCSCCSLLLAAVCQLIMWWECLAAPSVQTALKFGLCFSLVQASSGICIGCYSLVAV